MSEFANPYPELERPATNLERSELESQKLYGKTIEAWHQELTGENLDVPCSRYGRDAASCAWWAVASMLVYNHFYPGEMDEPEAHAEYAMSMAVNDHASLGPFVNEYLHVLPREVVENLAIDEEPV